jgi:hypothetical protein
MMLSSHLLGWLALLGISTCGAAEFTNLDFSSADTSGLGQYSNGDAEKLLPGWRLSYGGVARYTVFFNHSGDYSYVSLYKYAPNGVFLELGRYPANAPPWVLEQTGTVPKDARFLTYLSWAMGMTVQVNGQEIPPLSGRRRTNGYNESSVHGQVLPARN